MTRPFVTALLYASLVAAAIPAVALGSGLRAEIEAQKTGDMRKLVVHDAPKPVEGVAFLDAEGAEMLLAESNGKPRLVNFWATWCAPCRLEKPTLDALERELGGEIEIIAIATGRNPPDQIKRFNDMYGITSLETYLDPKGAAAREMGVLGLPVTALIDRDGNEVARLTGGTDWMAEEALAVMETLVAAE